MAAQTLSLILYAAYMSLTPCEIVFQETAKAQNPRMNLAADGAYLEEFAKAACQTSNPDILWLIANKETSFRFNIVRLNGEDPKVLEGPDARQYLRELKQNPEDKAPNIDIGVLQFNWYWHQDAFHDDPLKALSPARQVSYFVQDFGTEIERRCDDRWVGCFHNQTDRVRSRDYQASVKAKGRQLAMKVLQYMVDHRNSLAPGERSLLPKVSRKEFYEAFESVVGLSLPRKQILHFVDDAPNQRDRNILPVLEG